MHVRRVEVEEQRRPANGEGSCTHRGLCTVVVGIREVDSQQAGTCALEESAHHGRLLRQQLPSLGVTVRQRQDVRHGAYDIPRDPRRWFTQPRSHAQGHSHLRHALLTNVDVVHAGKQHQVAAELCPRHPPYQVAAV
ncbi:hypothetical protein Vretifemale_19001 [Volvox reticuliferus]|uniref:Uncharacterized protein n=1 Tax=Volvox reticuliferus TaxID=1737510 RepID=A0A8J4CYS7_9CHLO|nr:hypothetical protein Vretifemale_19001 [Volvox reticuliferus]